MNAEEETNKIKRPFRDFAFCETETAKAIINLGLWCYENDQMGLVVGDPGLGKTTALKELRGRRAGIRMATMNPAYRSLGAVLRFLYEELSNGWFTPATTLHEMHADVTQLIANSHLVIIDEAQHLNDQAIDIIRCSHDKTGVAILLCGNTTFRTRFGNERSGFGQVTSRIAARVDVTNPTEADVAAICESYEIPSSCQEFLFKQSQNSGGLRIVKTLYLLARQLADARGSGVTIADLSTALKTMLGGEERKKGSWR